MSFFSQSVGRRGGSSTNSQKMREPTWDAWRHKAARPGPSEFSIGDQDQGELRKAFALGARFKGAPKKTQ